MIGPMPTVDIQRACDGPGVPGDADLATYAAAALADLPDAELTLRLVDEDEGRALNHRYRNRDQATNVLSFPADLPARIPVPLLGDVVLCVPVIAREAEDQGKPLTHHWAHMIIHGILHLRGFDHTCDQQAEEMEAIERRLLAKLHVPDPYSC